MDKLILEPGSDNDYCGRDNVFSRRNVFERNRWVRNLK